MSSRHSISLMRKYSRWRSFMNGSFSVGRYVIGVPLPFLMNLSSDRPFLLLTDCICPHSAHATGAGPSPARLAYISSVYDRDNKNDVANRPKIERSNFALQQKFSAEQMAGISAACH